MTKAADLAGMKFGKLTAISRVENTTRGHTQWLCCCECGGEKIAQAAYLNKGTTRSCGCLGVEQRKNAAKSRCHEGSKTNNTAEYYSWQNMIDRCYKPTARGYKDYGGRGIIVCERWRSSFANFVADMGRRPDGMTLDRTNTDANYAPENCRWATRTEQANNRRTNRIITIDGKSMTVAQWARQLGISCRVIHARLYSGMNEHDSVMKPVRNHK